MTPADVSAAQCWRWPGVDEQTIVAAWVASVATGCATAVAAMRPSTSVVRQIDGETLVDLEGGRMIT
jgi:hypothetical protein